jgi:adenylate cyclase
MTEAEIAGIASWITEAGLEGGKETVLFEGFCRRAAVGGLPLARAIVIIDTLHPIYEGRAFRWERGKPEAELVEYGSSNEGELAERWRKSPLYRVWQSGGSLLRVRVTPESIAEFPTLAEFSETSIVDYLVNRFSPDGVIGEMDCFYAQWMTDREGGFSDDDIAALQRLTPFLGLAIKSASLARIAETLVETYLGRDAGRRVLSGRIARGVADRIDTVLWFSDLRDYTRIADTSAPEDIIPLLDDYTDAIVSAIHGNRETC